MSGHAAPGTVENGQAVLQRIQVPVISGTVKHAQMTNPSNNSTLRENASHRGKGQDCGESISNTQRVWTSLLSGATAGALAKTTIAPLDRTKINFQISNKPFSAKAAVEFLVESFKKEGLFSLWRGNSATMVRIVPYAAIQFTAHEQWKRILKSNDPQSKPSTRFFAGALAGVTSQSFTYPLDLMRARMAVTLKAEYKTLRQIFVRIYQEEGIRGYYRGFTPTILGVIPYAGFSFFTYDTLKQLLAVYTVNSPALAAMSALICGAAAGAVGQTTSYPLDIVRRRMQTSKMIGQDYHTILSTITKVYTEEGIMAFFKGLSMNWVKGPIAVGISFATYDMIRATLRQIIC